MTERSYAEQRRIVYLAHGGNKYLKQAVYSLLTLLWWLDNSDSDIHVIVYTDAPEHFPRHRCITIRELDAAEIRLLKGSHGYVHRVKLAILDEVVKLGDGPVIFVDCDTKWIRCPSNAFRVLESDAATFFMHDYEGELSPGFFPSYLDALVQRPELSDRFNISPPWRVWNSGTIGIPPGHPQFFAEALGFTDQLIGTVRHENWVEQLAVSVMAGREFRVQPFSEYLLHFWKDSCILEPVVEKALSGCSGDLSADARLCHDFQFDKELAKKRNSLDGWYRRRLAKLKRSLEKRRFHSSSSAE